MAGFDKIEQIINLKVTGSSELAKLNKKVEELASSQKKLRKEGKASSDEFLRGKTKLKGYRSDLNKATKEVNRLARGQKKAASFTGKLTKSFGLAALGAAAAMKAMQMLSRAVGSSLTVYKNFDFTMHKVKAITGATTEDYNKMRKAAKELGRTTFFTAEQVAQLQLNLSKMGFTTDEVLASEEAILRLAEATGEDLARSATVVASTIRGFGLDASEAGRVADVMGKAFTSSALDLEKFQTSMTKVAPISKIAGFSLEETTAVMASLTDAGIEASIAGTSLRNIFLKLNDPSSDLTKKLGRTVNNGDDLIAALKQLREEGVSVESVLEDVELRQVAAWGRMLDGADGIDKLIFSLENSNGEIKRMSDIINESTEGAFKRFNSAFEGLQIAIVEKVAPAIGSFLDRLTSLFNRIADNESGIGRFISILKTSTRVIAATTVGVTAYRIAVNASTIATKAAAAATNLFNKAIRANPIGLVVGLLTTAAASLLIFKDNAKEATDANNMLNSSLDDTGTVLTKQQRILKELEFFSESEGNVKKQKIKEGKEAIKVLENENKQWQTLIDTHKDVEGADSVYIKNLRTQIAENETLASKIGLSIDKLKNQHRVKLDLSSGSLSSGGGISDEDILRSDKMNIEREFAEENNRLLSEYLDGQINKDTLEWELWQNEMDRIAALKESREALGLSTLELDNKELEIMKEKGDQLDAWIAKNQEGANKEAKADTEKTQKMMQNAIMSSNNANEAFQKIVTTKINEILLEAMASMWKDGSIPFVAKLGLALGMKSIISPMIAKMFSGGEKFANGGLTNGGMFEGASHANGGVKFAVGGRIHEAEGGEAIINKRSTSMFKPLLSAINSHNSYGKKFALGGLTDGIQSKYAIGGMTASSLGDIVSGGGMGGSQTVMVVESDITRTQSRVSAIEAQASF